MALKQYLVALVSIALFTVAIIGFAVNFESANDAEVKISGEGGEEVMKLQTNVETNMSDFRGGSEDTYKSIIDSSLGEGAETTPSGGSFALTPWTLLKPIITIMDVGKKEIFGDKDEFAIFFTSLLAIMGTIMIFYIYKAWIGKMPD